MPIAITMIVGVLFLEILSISGICDSHKVNDLTLDVDDLKEKIQQLERN